MTTDANPILDLGTIRISALTDAVDLTHFNCGVQELDSFFRKRCQKHCRQNRIKAFYAHRIDGVAPLGIYTLSLSFESADLLDEPHKSIYRSEFPAVYIAHLAVSRGCQNQGLGTILLVNALRRAYAISSHVSYFGVALRSLNERTTQLYAKYGFAKRDEAPHPLMILPVWSLQDLFEKEGKTSA